MGGQGLDAQQCEEQALAAGVEGSGSVGQGGEGRHVEIAEELAIGQPEARDGGGGAEGAHRQEGAGGAHRGVDIRARSGRCS